MLNPLDFENRPLIERLRRMRGLTALSLLCERLSTVLWRLLTWILFFCGLWLFEAPLQIPVYGPVAAFVIFALGAGYFLYADLRRFRFPSAREIDRHIETQSNLSHRPITGLQDRLANPHDADTRSLWQKSRAHFLSLLPGLKPGWPRALLAKEDPRALRLAALMFCGLGILLAGPSWPERIESGLTPLSFKDSQIQDNIHLWITPPDYTGLAQIAVTGKDKGKTIEIPAGSTLKVTLHGGWGQPTISIGDLSLKLNHADGSDYILETPIKSGGAVTLSQLYIPKASWDFTLIPDTPPQITAAKEPESLPDGMLRFHFKARDDYGVENLAMAMTLDPAAGEPPLGEPASEIRSIMSPPKTEIDINPVYDLTAHPWAGLPVVIEFEAHDHLNQIAKPATVKMVLPERAFHHPVAIQLIEIRRKLAWAPEIDYESHARALESLLVRPGDFRDDLLVFLAIRSAASRLIWAEEPSADTARGVMALLWDTALRVEDDNLSLAARDLRQAQDALEKALQNPNISDAEIARLMNDLRQAMANYLTSMQEKLHQRMADGKPLSMIPPEMLAQSIDPEALAAFLDQMESQMRSGDHKGAQELLSQLQRFMDMTNPALTMQLPRDMQMMNKGINELQALIERQQDLLDQTLKQADVLQSFQNFPHSFGHDLPPDQSLLKNWGIDDMPPTPQAVPDQSPSPVMNTKPNQAEQEALRYILGQLMLEAGGALGDVPENMGLAEQEMRGSSDRLGENDPKASAPHQEQALTYLKEMQKQLEQQFVERMRQMSGLALGNMRFDPLGRPYGDNGNQPGAFPGSRVQIPDEAERRQAQEILKLLRRRSSEMQRPQDELEYYRRLLKQF